MWIKLSKERRCNKEVKGCRLDSWKPTFKGNTEEDEAIRRTRERVKAKGQNHKSSHRGQDGVWSCKSSWDGVIQERGAIRGR